MNASIKRYQIFCLHLIIVGQICTLTFSLYAEKKSILKKENSSEILEDASKDIYQGLKNYAEFISLIKKRAFRDIDFSTIIQSSLRNAASEIDAHSAFFGKEIYKSAIEATSGEFSGIGVSIITKTPEDDSLVIIDVIEEGPSCKAGIRSGDKIVEIDGEKLKGLSADESVVKLKGKVGSVVTLKIVRAKKPLEFKIKRDIIKDQTSLCYFFKQHKIYYLSLKLFTENAAHQMATLLSKANDKKCKGILLDLRRNPGGILQTAIDIAGLFLKKGSLVVVTKNKNRTIVDTYYTTNKPILKTEIPIFILIDNFTASAAEILAGCLRHYSAFSETKNRSSFFKKNKTIEQNPLQVFLIGDTTFGKGSVQEVIPMSNDCALKLTTMLYFLPNDLSIQATGIKPDFTIKSRFIPVDEMRWINDMYGKEISLKRHITIDEVTGKKNEITKPKKESPIPTSILETIELNGNKKDNPIQKESDTNEPDQAKKWEDKIRENLGNDIQIQSAINMINMLNFAKQSHPEMVNSRNKALAFLKQHYVTDDPIEIEQVK